MVSAKSISHLPVYALLVELALRRRTGCTTNINERSFREVRSRTRPTSSFTSPARYDSINFGVIIHLNCPSESKPVRDDDPLKLCLILLER